MRSTLRAITLVLVATLALGSAAASAGATTIEDLIKFKENPVYPVSDEVLIALIESDGSVFHLTADDILPLKDKGFSDALIIAMLKTAKRAPRPTVLVATPAAEDEASNVRETEVIVPQSSTTSPASVVVNVTQHVEQKVEQPRNTISHQRTVYVPVAVPVVVRPPAPPPKPVYWGWGGQQRPDSWQTTPVKPQTPPKQGGGS